MTIMTNLPRAAALLPPLPANTGAVTPGQTQGGSTTAQPATDPTAGVSKNMFLQLLVAQIKNQNPLSPTDSMQFVGQLAQFTELEQVMGMRQDMAAVRVDLDKAATPITPPVS